jgi:hypothetical protein
MTTPINVTATVSLPNDSKVYLVNKVFPDELLQQIIDCFSTYPTNKGWTNTANFNPLRYVFNGVHPAVAQVNKYATFLADEISTIVGKKIRPVYPSFWIDLPGYELAPHVDVDNFEHAIQVYIGDDEQVKNSMGTSVYADYDTPLFDICYRQNSGYLFDSTHTILHAIRKPILEGSIRKSVYIRFTTQI